MEDRASVDIRGQGVLFLISSLIVSLNEILECTQESHWKDRFSF